MVFNQTLLVTGLSVVVATCTRGNTGEARRDTSATPVAVGAAPPRPAAATSPAPADVAAPACPLQLGYPRLAQPGGRVVAIGDVHGDLEAARAALRTAGVLDSGYHWSGGATVVVQVGDVLDRGDDEAEIVELFERLEREAEAAGGRFLWLIGNHELMNAAGDFRYVTPDGFADFAAEPARADIPAAAVARLPAEARGRAHAFLFGGRMAKVFAGQPLLAVVGDTVFSHAAIVPAWLDKAAAGDANARCWLLGYGTAPADALTSDDSPVWTRDFATDPVDCAAVDATLKRLGVQRMVFGHTVQQGGISSACDGRVWRVDVGLAAYYQGPIEVLEVGADAKVQVLRGAR